MKEQGVNISSETIRRWRIGEAIPNAQVSAVLAHVLNVPAPWLVLGEIQSFGSLLFEGDTEGCSTPLLGAFYATLGALLLKQKEVWVEVDTDRTASRSIICMAQGNDIRRIGFICLDIQEKETQALPAFADNMTEAVVAVAKDVGSSFDYYRIPINKSATAKTIVRLQSRHLLVGGYKYPPICDFGLLNKKISTDFPHGKDETVRFLE